MDTIYDKLTAIADSIREKTGKSGSLTLDDMAYEISTIKGSADLNFDIIAYESEEALLASTPAENTIGVVTTTPITSWAFSATEPTSPEPGMVWIKVGTESVAEFNALKKNSFQVYPITASQHIDNVWVTMIVKSYMHSAWVEWLQYLFDGNAGTTAFTQEIHSSISKAPTISNGTMNFAWTDSASDFSSGIVFGTGSGVNLSNISTIVVEMDQLTASGGTWFIVSIVSSKISGSDITGGYVKTLASNTVVAAQSMPKNGIFSIDVTSYSGVRYIYIGSVDGFSSLPSNLFNNGMNGSISAKVRKVGYF